MVRNYFMTALRNFRRHKLYSFINIAGLTVGLACVLFILLFLRDELSWDQWIPGTDNLYRLSVTYTAPGRGPEFFSAAPLPLSTAMRAELPEVVAETHFTPQGATAQVGNRQFRVALRSVDPNFLEVIRLPLIRGDAATALANPESLVLTETQARKFFGTTDIVGKTVTLNGAHTLTVTGVMRELPYNTQFLIDMLMPDTSSADLFPASSPEQHSWSDIRSLEYVRLAPHADVKAVLAKLPALIDRHFDAMKEMHLGLKGSQLMHVHFTRFSRVWLDPYGINGVKGDWTRFYGFSAIALLVLLIAGINYMNLATARAIVRRREVSIRKVLGARRGQLIAQFLGESMLVALVALALALALVGLLLPAFDALLMRPIAYDIFNDWPLTLVMLAVASLAGLLGGIYPALVLSGFRPAATLGTGNAASSGSGLLRTALVVLQFSISIGLGIAAMVIFSQVNYALAMDLGFDRRNVMVIQVPHANSLNGFPGAITSTTRDSLARTLAADPAIAQVAQSESAPFDGFVEPVQLTPAGSTANLLPNRVVMDPDFLDLYRIELVAGRNLSRDRGGDIARAPDAANPHPALNVLVNQAAARQMGFTPAGALGKTATMGGIYRVTVVGVVADVKFDGPGFPMRPTIYYDDPGLLGEISVRIKPGRTQQALADVDRIWRRFVYGVAIQSRFEDATLDRYFVRDEREGRIFAIFVGIAIFIAAMGLFGLAAFSTGRRTKEIGLRKAFGAKTRDIVLLLLWQFSIPVLIANLIAWPVAYFYLHRWLEGYAYRISLSPLYFLGAGAAALVIAWATVIVHAAHVARASPIHALRYE